MANTNGTLFINGLQLDVATGQVQIGPFNIPFSGVSAIANIPANSTNVATAIPTGCAGVALIPNGTSGMTAAAGFISAQLTRLSILYPSLWTFDPASSPSNVYVTTSNTSGALVTIVCW